jgi:iron complex outermembrane receptor protein
MTNVGKSYRYGTEFSAGFMPARFITWDMNLTLSRNKIPDFTEYYTDYNSSDGSSQYKSRNLGKVDIAYSPSVIATSDLSVTVIPVLRIHLTSKYVGKQYFDNTMNSERMLDPYFVNNIIIDAEPELKFVKGFNLQLMVNNILNSMYESNAYGGNWFEDGVEKTWAYYFPQACINFMVKIGLKF